MKLLITVSWPSDQIAQVEAAYPQVEFATALGKEDAIREATDAEVIFGRVDRDLFLAAKQLRWIQCHGAGVESMMVIPELVNGNVVLTTTSGAHAATIAEHFFGQLIALARQFLAVHSAQQRKEWIKWDDWIDRVGVEPAGLLGLTLGIVGLGNIGRAIAERAAAFGMEVIAVDAFAVAKPSHVSDLWLVDELPTLLRRADVIAVTVPSTPETSGMLNADALELIKPSAFLCLLSRGGIVDENKLAEMLQAGRLAGAALDSTDPEPPREDSPLWDAPNLIMTPHYAGRSAHTRLAATEIFRENLGHYLAGESLQNVVDKRLGF